MAVPLLSLAAGGLLSVLFLSEIGIYWLWELPPLVLAAALLAMLTRLRTREVAELLLDRRAADDGGGPAGGVLLALVVGAMVGAVALANRATESVALETGLAVGLLPAAGVVLRHQLPAAGSFQSR